MRYLLDIMEGIGMEPSAKDRATLEAWEALAAFCMTATQMFDPESPTFDSDFPNFMRSMLAALHGALPRNAVSSGKTVLASVGELGEALDHIEVEIDDATA